MEPRFHGKTLAMIESPPGISEANLRILRQQEARNRFRFPPSVLEWYAHEGGADLLSRFSNNDHAVPLGELGDPAEHWYGAGPRDFISQGLLWIMNENQGVCNWAVRLDGTDDPPVVVEVDSAPDEHWRPLASSFTEFVYCQVWDHLPGAASCEAQDDLQPSDLDWLRRRFEALPTTASWPGSANYRFHSPHGRILLWYNEQHGTDWFIHAGSSEDLEQLLRTLWDRGNLAESLHGLDESGQRVLDEMRRS